MSLVNQFEEYLGKHYSGGLQDCLTTVRNFYAQEYNIHIANYARPTNWEAYPELNFFEKIYRLEGFSKATNNTRDVRVGDVFLMAIGGKLTNHCAVYLGQNQMLHHLYGRRSSIDEYSYQWQSRVRFVLRHEERESKMSRQGTQILELLPDHLKLRLARRMEDSNDQ